MKKIQTTIFSLLLLSLCFVSFHDYFISQSHTHEISCVDIYLDADQSTETLVHETMHHFVAFFENENIRIVKYNGESPFFKLASMSSYQTNVLLRPPLS